MGPYSAYLRPRRYKAAVYSYRLRCTGWTPSPDAWGRLGFADFEDLDNGDLFTRCPISFTHDGRGLTIEPAADGRGRGAWIHGAEERLVYWRPEALRAWTAFRLLDLSWLRNGNAQAEDSGQGDA